VLGRSFAESYRSPNYTASGLRLDGADNEFAVCSPLLTPELDEWRIEGLSRAARLRLHGSSINEAAAVVSNVFGDDWLALACQRDRGGRWQQSHPIGGLLLPPGDNQIVGLLELVEYLKASAESPVFPELVAGLKAQYGPTFLQMAAAYRLKRLGATNLEFEPPVQGGLKGDIVFELEGRPIIAECYIPRVMRSSLEVHWLLQRCLAMREGLHPSIVSIAIKLKVDPTASQRKTTLRLVRELSAEIDSTAGTVPRSQFTETEAAYISVAPTKAVAPGQDSVGMQDPRFPDMRGEQPFVFGRITVARAARIKAGHVPPPIETRDHVAIWLSDEQTELHSLEKDLDEPLAELGKKLERKLAQTRLDDRTGRLLIVSSWMTGELRRVSDHAMAGLRKLLFRKHASVAGVLFMQHSYRQSIARPEYEIDSVLPDTNGWINTEHVIQLRRLESEYPVPAVRA